VALGNIQLLGMPINQKVQMAPGLAVRALLVPHRDEFSETLAFIIEGPNKSALYLPDIDKWDRWDTDIRALIQEVDYAFLDATFFTVEELPGRNMSEIPHPFVAESLEVFADLDPADKAKVWFIHFNHSNPLLIEGSAAQKQVESSGFHVARQGMRLPM
jgi:pyrroloquinoline quinone biosynthesis protein B